MKTICEWNKCNKLGEFKAPVEKDNSKKYRMLCLEHVKEFNKNWNYFFWNERSTNYGIYKI